MSLHSFTSLNSANNAGHDAGNVSEGSQVQTVSDDARVTRARLHVASALMIAERGRPAEAERRLREALGVLERRRRFAGAARAAATLGCLLRERGEPSRAESTLERARVLFAAAETTTEWSPLTGKRPKSPSDTLTVHPGEREDYVLARALLWAGGGTDDRQSAGPSAGDGLARVADGTIELFRTQTCGDGLETICARLRTIIDATAIAVLSPTAATTPLVTAGPLPHAIGRRARELRLSTRGVSIDGGDGSAQAVVPMRIAEHDQALASLVAYWSRPPVAARHAGVHCLLRVASVLCASAVNLVVDRQTNQSHEHSSGLVGSSRQIRELRATVTEQAACPFPILIEGETGSGKEVVARGLHRGGPRRNAAFCAVNCAALTDELFEAEVFGHARGAFTGAVTQRTGLFEAAHRGTLFLDEVGELSARAQAKLLRVVQDGEVRRVGETTTRHVDVRIITATNRVLASEVAAGRFRQDLLFRLAVVRLCVPPLRTRGEDIVLLAKHFWARALAQTGGHAALGTDTLAALASHDWPGNVRELENVMSALAVRAPKRGWVPASLLPAELRAGGSECGTTLAQARQGFERVFVRAALRRAGGRPGLAANELGISRQGLAKLMTRLDLRREG